MVREERVKEEFKLAVIDSHNEKDLVQIGNYFKGDYVGRQLLISFISGSCCYFVVLFLVVMAQLEDLVDKINKLDYMQLGVRVAVWYLGFMIVYMCITALVYTIRYNHMRGKALRYLKHIKRLKAMYGREDKLKERSEENDSVTGN